MCIIIIQLFIIGLRFMANSTLVLKPSFPQSFSLYSYLAPLAEALLEFDHSVFERGRLKSSKITSCISRSSKTGYTIVDISHRFKEMITVTIWAAVY